MNIRLGENTYNNYKNQDDFLKTDSVTYSKEIIKNNSISAAAVFDGSKANGIAKEKDIHENAMSEISDAKIQKDYMTVMSNTLSDEDFAELKKEGYKPGEMKVSETVTTVDRIKATMASAGKVIAGYNDDLDSSLLKEVTGSEAYAAEIEKSFKNNNVPLTEDNINDSKKALEILSSLNPLDLGTITYMTVNSLEPTISNIYKAQHSGLSGHTGPSYFTDASGYQGSLSTDDSLEDIENQIKKILENSGVSIDEDNFKKAETMVKENIPLTERSFVLFNRLSNLKLPMDIKEAAEKIAFSVMDGKRPEDAVLDEEEPLLLKAADLVKKVSEITDDAVIGVADSGKELTIKNLLNENVENSSGVTTSKAAIKATRIMAEVRISMTVSSTYMLMKNNINVDTRDLYKLVEDLKEAENRQFEAVFGKEDNELNRSLNNLFEETLSKSSELKNLPVAGFGAVSVRSSVTLNIVYSEAKISEERYLKAGERYETLGTEIRGDLGDSIKKAFGNIGELLENIGLEKSGENERAVRILGYNSMDINISNVENVKNTVNLIENVLEKMTPGKTLSLIREGINPLEISLDELDKSLNKLNTTENEAERFSQYLVRLEDNNQITEAERESYIGIYRLINQIEKDDMAAAGTLMNANAEINFKNLLTAVRTRKNKGIDTKLSDDNGELDSLIRKGVSISEQIEKAFLRPVGEKQNADNYKEDYNESFDKYENQLLREAAKTGEDVVSLGKSINLPETAENLLALNALINDKGNMYKTIKRAVSNIDKASDKPVMPVLDNILSEPLKSFDSEENAKNAFDEMNERLKSFVNSQALNTTDTIDLKGMAFSMNQIFVSSKLVNEECYEVPLIKGDQVSTVSVRIRHGISKRVDISFESEEYGRVSGFFDSSLKGFIGSFVTDSDKPEFKSLTDRLLNAFEERNQDVSEISFTNSGKVNTNIFRASVDKYSKEATLQGSEERAGRDAISTDTLYKLAKTFLEVLMV